MIKIESLQNFEEHDELIKSFMEAAYNINSCNHIDHTTCKCEKCVSIKKRTSAHMLSLDKTVCHMKNTFDKIR